MKTTVSVPDDIFERSERLAGRTGRSRSALYTTALREYLARHDPDGITQSMNDVIERLERSGQPTTDDPFRNWVGGSDAEPTPVDDVVYARGETSSD